MYSASAALAGQRTANLGPFFTVPTLDAKDALNSMDVLALFPRTSYYRAYDQER